MTSSLSSAAHGISDSRLPGHWLLASLGKKVLRPGGRELTARLLAEIRPGPRDDVVEFAPGLGATARLVLQNRPRSYTAVERDPEAAARLEKWLSPLGHRCVTGAAEDSGLPDASASLVYGEAMLTMQPAVRKLRIAREAHRLLRTGGRYGIHELSLTPDSLDPWIRKRIEGDLSLEIHTGVLPLTGSEWRSLLESVGFRVLWEARAPMHLLEPGRMVSDEGLLGTLRVLWNMIRKPEARARALAMRRLFRRYALHLEAVALVCERI